MNRVLAFFFLMACLATGYAQNSKALQQVRINGADYVRIKEWCDYSSLKGSWTKKDEEIQVADKSWKMIFTVNSIKSQINGIDVRLSLPVLLRNNTPYISVIDLQKTINPLLYPSRNAPNDKIKTICLDPGHGGRDTGKIDKRNHEKNYTLLLAQELARVLTQAGFKVISTRGRDQYVELPDRPAIANRYGADLFISLHFNAFEERQVRGAETYCLTPAGVESSNSGGGTSSEGRVTGNAQDEKNMLLAYAIQRSVLKGLNVEDRGVKRARYRVLQSARMPAVLIEAGFMSNPDEAKKIYDASYRRKIALAILDGIQTYKRIVEPTASASAEKPSPSK